MRKILSLLTLAAFPFIASHSAKLPIDGYTGPYVYNVDAEFGYLEADALYDEDVVTLNKAGGGSVVVQAVNCSDVAPTSCCDYCASVSNNFPEYNSCVEAVFDSNSAACAHNVSAFPLASCPVHGVNDPSQGQVPVTCPIGGDAAVLLIFALPYGILRLWRKRKS